MQYGTDNGSYRPRKMGLTDRKIHAEKHAALVATYGATRQAKEAIMCQMYGGTPDQRFEPVRVLKGRGNSPLDVYHATMRFTERGDFSHLQSTPGVHFSV